MDKSNILFNGMPLNRVATVPVSDVVALVDGVETFPED